MNLWFECHDFCTTFERVLRFSPKTARAEKCLADLWFKCEVDMVLSIYGSNVMLTRFHIEDNFLGDRILYKSRMRITDFDFVANILPSVYTFEKYIADESGQT